MMMSAASLWRKSVQTAVELVIDAVQFMPKSAVWALMVWLGGCGLLNLGLWFFEPTKYALPYVQNVMNEVHTSALDFQNVHIWVLPWGTIYIQVPHARWQSSKNTLLPEKHHLAPVWFVQAESLKIPIHLWRFFIGGKSALLGTMTGENVFGTIRAREGMQDFSAVLATFKTKPNVTPSPYTRFIKVNMKQAHLVLENMPENPAVQPGNYQLNLDRTRMRWVRDDQHLQWNTNAWELFQLHDKTYQTPVILAKGNLRADTYLAPWVKAFTSSLENNVPKQSVSPYHMWQAFQSRGDVALSMEAHGWHEALKLYVLPTMVKTEIKQTPSQLTFRWNGRSVFRPAQFQMDVRSLVQKWAAPYFEIEGEWTPVLSSKTADVKPVKSSLKQSSLNIHRLFFNRDEIKVNAQGALHPHWTPDTPVQQAFSALGWHVKGQADAVAPSAKSGSWLTRLLLAEGFLWRTGRLHASVHATGRGSQHSLVNADLNTRSPLGIRSMKPLVLGQNVMLPSGTRLENLTFSAKGNTRGLTISNASLALALKPNEPLLPVQVQLKGDNNYRRWAGSAKTAKLAARYAKDFLSVNPMLVPEPYHRLIQRQVNGYFEDVAVAFNTNWPHAFTVQANTHLAAHHPKWGQALPLQLAGPLWLDKFQLVLGKHKLLNNKAFQVQVAQQPAITGNYSIRFDGAHQQAELVWPKQSLSSIVSWAGVFGAALPVSLKAGDTLAISNALARWSPAGLDTLTLKRMSLELENAGRLLANTSCKGIHCQWNTQGNVELLAAKQRAGLTLNGVALRSGVGQWNLYGGAMLGQIPKITNASGNMTLDNVQLALQQHPQNIVLPRVIARMQDTRWWLEPLTVNWGPIYSDISGEGTWNASPHYALNVDLRPIDMQNALASGYGSPTVHQRAWQTWWEGVGLSLPTRVNPTGLITLNARIMDGDVSGALELQNAGVFFPTVMPDPISRINGRVSLDTRTGHLLSQNGISGYYGLSPWYSKNLQLNFTPDMADMMGKFSLKLHPRELNRIAALTSGEAMTHYVLVGDATLDTRLHLPKWSFHHPNSQGQALLTASVSEYKEAGLPALDLPTDEPRLNRFQSSTPPTNPSEYGEGTSEQPASTVEEDTAFSTSLREFTQRHHIEALTFGEEDSLSKSVPESSTNSFTQEPIDTNLAARIPQQPLDASEAPPPDFGKRIPQMDLAPPVVPNPQSRSTLTEVNEREKAPTPELVMLQALLNMKGGSWRLTQGELYPLGSRQPIYVSASLDAPEEATHLYSSKGRIWTPEPLELKHLHYQQEYPYESGQFQTDVQWQKADGAPTGFIRFWDIVSPSLEINSLGGDVLLSETRAKVNVERFETSRGSNFSWKAQMPLPQPLPFQFKESRIYSPYWDLNDLTSSLTKQLAFWKAPLRESHQVGAQWRPETRISLPLELRNSLVEWDLGVFQNIAVERGEGLLNFYQNGLIQLDDTRFHIVDGKLQMALSMDPFNNNSLSLKLKADNVPANPVFYGLTGVQQLVLGKLSGNFELSTSGQTNEEFLTNASGQARVHIAEGRVPELVAVENILSKVSILRGGLLNLDIGDVTSFLKRQSKKKNSQVIETYDATLFFVNGLMLTKDLRSDGPRMDLNVKGSMRLLDGYSNMAIRADIDTNDGDSLKPWKLSLRKIIQRIPLVGKLPGREYGLLDYVPVLGYIPAFGFDSGDTVKYYVRVNGQLDDPKDFELPQWVKGQQTFDNWEYTLPSNPSGVPMQMQEPNTNSEP
jgi:hypothetical protein